MKNLCLLFLVSSLLGCSSFNTQQSSVRDLLSIKSRVPASTSDSIREIKMKKGDIEYGMYVFPNGNVKPMVVSCDDTDERNNTFAKMNLNQEWWPIVYLMDKDGDGAGGTIKTFNLKTLEVENITYL